MYKSEDNLVRRLVQQLRGDRSPWGGAKVFLEFNYQRGRADVVALTDNDDHLIAFEAKLRKWREALHQAYRNTCFAHSSYVVVPRCVALTAQHYEAEFRSRNVGLCYVESNRIVLVFRAEKQTPLEPWLVETASAAARGYQHGARRS